MKRLVPIVLPDCGLAGMALRSSVWHAAVGETIKEGERVLEVVAESVLIDIPAPISGVLYQRLVGEDEPLVEGQILGMLETLDEAPGKGTQA